VIAEHDVQRASGGGSLCLQTHQQLHDLTRARAAVEKVAETHDVRRAGRPAQIPVDDARGAQQRGELVGGAVHVAERDDARHIGPGAARLLRPRGRKRQHACGEYKPPHARAKVRRS
jgi:hypothetical protein